MIRDLVTDNLQLLFSDVGCEANAELKVLHTVSESCSKDQFLQLSFDKNSFGVGVLSSECYKIVPYNKVQ